MKEPELRDWACRLLEDQLGRLGELRNANPRDPGFKLWRQTTLTVIQRVWPGNLQRSERFRRVPFTPPSPRPNRAQVREHFERGCAEAANYLRELIVEIQQGALDPGRQAGKPEELPSQPMGPSSIAASLAAPLPGEVASAAAPASHPSPLPAPAGAPPPIPGFLSSSVAAGPGGTMGPAQPAPPAANARPAGPANPEGAKRTVPARSGKAPRRSDRRALKEMLGFVDEPSQGAGTTRPPLEEPQEPERPGVSFDEPALPSPPASLGGQRSPGAPASTEFYGPRPLDGSALADETEEDDLPLVGEEDLSLPADSQQRAIAAEDLEPLEDVEPLDEDGEIQMGDDPAEMLRSSSWAMAQETPTTAASVPTLTRQSPVAAALQALASEVADLGVPEGKRAAARAALTDLARQIDERSADWDTLRDAFGLAMEYPPLARRVVPLLVPYLDLE